MYQALSSIEKDLKEFPPKKIGEWIVMSLIDDIPISWTEVRMALLASLANPVEIALVKEAFVYYSGGAAKVTVGQIVSSIKSIFGEWGEVKKLWSEKSHFR